MSTATQSATNQFLTDCRAIVGAENVFKGDDPAGDFVRDRFGPYFDTEREPRPGGVVRPGNLDELRAVVVRANELGVGVWTSSRGRNFGYGAASPVRRGDVALSLIRMDRILEIDEERAFALVEPGVNYAMLLEEIEKRGLKLWPGTPSAPFGSVLGNALDRGVGYNVMADHYEKLCGLEVLLADGTLLRTGTGSQSNSNTWSENKAGFGPMLDGIFSQSNFGIVTKGGVWLLPEPGAFRHAEVFLENPDHLERFVDVLARLRRERVIESGVNTGPGRDFMSSLMSGPAGQGAPGGPAPGGAPRTVTRARIGYVGSPAVVEAKWQDTLAALEGIDYRLEGGYYEAPYDYSQWGPDACLAAGIPTPNEHPDWDNAHFSVFGGLIIPNTGRDYLNAWRVLDGIYAKFGLKQPFPPGFHMHTARSMVVLIAAPIAGDPMMPSGMPVPDNDTSVQIIRECLAVAAEHGWTEYRAGTLFMDDALSHQDFESGSKAAVYERIKDALDPNGILSPGKSGIWGAAAR